MLWLVLVWIDRRLPFKENQLGGRILAHLPVSVALTIVHFYVLMVMRALLGLSAWSMVTSFSPVAALQGLLWSWLVYWAIFGARQTFRYYEHYLASELRLERMERSFSGSPQEFVTSGTLRGVPDFLKSAGSSESLRGV